MRSGGSDPATTCLVAFGGGGPMIVTGIAEAAGIKRIIIPRLASVFSAFGIGFSHLAHEYQAPLVSGDADAIAAELRVRAQLEMYGEGVAPEECRYEPSLWGVEDDKVVVAPISDAAGFMARVDGPRVNFKAVYELPTSVLTSDDGRRGEATPSSGSTSLVMSAEGPSDIATYDDRELTAGRTITGPGLSRGAYLTCLIREGWSLRVSTNLELVIEAN